ncbi:MAG: hypothetical protein J6S67_15250 [Methanobrevibacter sp.]|nr:hypothetical protein [Methanobrevibacter sp.]
MKRIVDMETIGQVLQNYMEVGYEVALKRGTSLLDVKESIDDRIDFLFAIELIDKKELNDMFQFSEDGYNEAKAKADAIKEDNERNDVGF